MKPTDLEGLWWAWLGRGGVPGPLDRLLSARRVDRPTHLALTATVRWAPLVLEALGRRTSGGPDLLEALRAVGFRDLLAGAALCEGRPGPAALRERLDQTRSRLRADGKWGAKAVLHGIPRGFGPLLERRSARSGSLDPTLDGWLEAQTRPAPLWVAPADERVAGELEAEGFTVRPDATALAAEGFGGAAGATTPRGEAALSFGAPAAEPSPARRMRAALAVEGARGIASSGPYREGRLEVQDLGSQRVGAAVVPRPGQRVWDVCAGRGGKTLQLARALRGRGVVHATDTDPKKLEQLRIRLRRAGLADVVRVHAWDGQQTPAFGPEVRGGFDLVLVDAPCSSTGTWRRNPDAKLRVDPREIGGHAELQRHLVGLGRAALRPEGRLVYATCSFAVEEDEDVAESAGMTIERTERPGPPELDSDTFFFAVLRAG